MFVQQADCWDVSHPPLGMHLAANNFSDSTRHHHLPHLPFLPELSRHFLEALMHPWRLGERLPFLKTSGATGHFSWLSGRVLIAPGLLDEIPARLESLGLKPAALVA